MRVAVLTNAYPPKQTGGVARIAFLQVEMLRAMGHEARVWCPVVPWFSHAAITRLFHHWIDLKEHEAIKSTILEWKPDVLLTHNLTGCGFATPKCIQQTGVQWIHILHDVQLFEPSGQVVNVSKITWWQKCWGRARIQALGSPNMVISPTQWLLDQHTRRGFFLHTATAPVVLPNPAPSILLFARIRERSPFKVLFVGALTKAKGSEFLIKLGQTLSSFQFTIIGSGPEEKAMKEALPHATFLGQRNSDQIIEHMKEMDVLLVPSTIEENQPTVILEAAAVGLPVIASNKGGIVETLAGAGKSLPLNVDEWKKEIEHLAQDHHYYTPAVQKMTELATRHDPEKYAQRFVSLVKSNT